MQRFPHLLEQRMFIVKLLNRDQPLGVVSLRVGRQWQCCYCPCSACTKTSAHPDLRHLRQAVYQSGLLNKPELQQYMHYSAGRPVPPDQVMQHMRFAVGGEGLPMEPGAQAGPFALCKCEEQTIYAIRCVCGCVCGCVAVAVCVAVWLCVCGCVCVCVCVWLLLCVWLCVGRCLCLVPREAQLVTLLVASCVQLPSHGHADLAWLDGPGESGAVLAPPMGVRR